MYNVSIVLLYKQVYNVITVKETDSRKAERKIDMIKWIKVDQKTGERAKRGSNSFMPHDYVAVEEHFRIENHSFSRRKGAWVLTTHKGSEIEKFDTLKAAKAYAETLV